MKISPEEDAQGGIVTVEAAPTPDRIRIQRAEIDSAISALQANKRRVDEDLRGMIEARDVLDEKLSKLFADDE